MFIGFLSVKPQFFGKIFPDVSLNLLDLSVLIMLILVAFCVTNAKNRDKTTNSGYILAKTRIKHVRNSINKATLLLKITPYRGKCRQKWLIYMPFIAYLHR